MIDNLRALYIFAKSVELGSFRETARALNLSPSVVSYHISRLESDLKVALLYRSTRKLTLTHEGKALFDNIMPLIDGLERGIDSLATHVAAPIGQLNITAPTAFSRGALTVQIAKFIKQYPKVKLSINYTDENQDLIENGIDLAIRGGEMRDSALKARKIFELKRKLVASPDYVSTRPIPESPADLERWDWVWFTVTPNHRTFINQKTGEQQKVRFKSRITVDNGDAMCNFVSEGLGLATPTTYLIDDRLKTGRMVEVLPDWRIEPIDVHAVWPANSPKTGLTNRFVDYLIKAKIGSY